MKNLAACRKNNTTASYKFYGRAINLKSFNSVYQLTNFSDINLKRVVLSAPVIYGKTMSGILLRIKEWNVCDKA